MSTKYDVFIAGGGIGGLLASSLLSQQGKSCYLAERLPFFGGRFTTHSKDGFEIPTGAVHMIPHSQKGILGRTLLQKLRLPIEIIDTHNFTTWFWPNHTPISHQHFVGIYKAFPNWKQRYFIIKKLILRKETENDEFTSFHDFLLERTDDPQISQFFNAITGFALSLDISEISVKSMYQFLNRLRLSGKAGVPIGGCKEVINKLVDHSRSNNVTLKRNHQLIKVESDGSRLKHAVIQNVRTGEEKVIIADEFILNLGINQINDILKDSEQKFRLPSCPLAKGGGLIFRTKPSLLKKSTVAQFPSCKYVKGAVEPTLISPNLAPRGEHLFLTHQVFHSNQIDRDIKFARDEILSLFPSLREEDELCAHSFHRDWPVNYSAQGTDNDNFSKVFKNLYFVGDGFKGNRGWFMTEGITYGVNLVVDKILSQK
jgi:phytoene dehydrogenase-like protein